MKVIQIDIKMYGLVVPIIMPSVKENGQQMSKYTPMLIFFVPNHISRAFSLEYQMDEIKKKKEEVHHTNKS